MTNNGLLLGGAWHSQTEEHGQLRPWLCLALIQEASLGSLCKKRAEYSRNFFSSLPVNFLFFRSYRFLHSFLYLYQWHFLLICFGSPAVQLLWMETLDPEKMSCYSCWGMNELGAQGRGYLWFWNYILPWTLAQFKVNIVFFFFFNSIFIFKLKYIWCTNYITGYIMQYYIQYYITGYVTGVQYSDAEFLKAILYCTIYPCS